MFRSEMPRRKGRATGFTPDCSPHELDSSLRRLAAIPLESAYPGHGDPMREGGAAHLDRAIEYLDRLVLPPNLL